MGIGVTIIESFQRQRRKLIKKKQEVVSDSKYEDRGRHVNLSVKNRDKNNKH